jgi:hypothetical protein
MPATFPALVPRRRVPGRAALGAKTPLDEQPGQHAQSAVS